MTRACCSAITRRKTRCRGARISDSIQHVEGSTSTLPLCSVINGVEVELADTMPATNIFDSEARSIVWNAHTGDGILLKALVALASPLICGLIKNAGASVVADKTINYAGRLGADRSAFLDVVPSTPIAFDLIVGMALEWVFALFTEVPNVAIVALTITKWRVTVRIEGARPVCAAFRVIQSTRHLIARVSKVLRSTEAEIPHAMSMTAASYNFAVDLLCTTVDDTTVKATAMGRARTTIFTNRVVTLTIRLYKLPIVILRVDGT